VIKASYGFSPGPITTPDRSSSLFLASVDSNIEPIVLEEDWGGQVRSGSPLEFAFAATYLQGTKMRWDLYPVPKYPPALTTNPKVC